MDCGKNSAPREAWLDPRLEIGIDRAFTAPARLPRAGRDVAGRSPVVSPVVARRVFDDGTLTPALARMTGMIGERWPSGMPVASTQTLEAHGIGDRLLTSTVRAGVVLRLRRGAYAKASTWQELRPWEQDMLRIEAHSAGTGGTAVYSHLSAARLHGCSTWNCGTLVHVATAYTPARGSSGPDTRAHFAELTNGEIVEIERPAGPPVRATSLERTVIDCSRLLDFERAVVIADQAVRFGADREIMNSYLVGGLVRGARKVRRVLEAADGRSESVGESRTRVLLLQRGIEGAVPQLQVRSSAGEHRGDFGWPGERVILEFDGRAKYFDYRPTEEMLFEERRREKALREAGWEFVRVEWADLARPWEVERRIQTALNRPRT